MPIREIEQKFTVSELVITAWRSQEIASKFDDIPEREQFDDSARRRKPKGNFINKSGELDLSIVSGPEAVKAFKTIGLHFPVINK